MDYIYLPTASTTDHSPTLTSDALQHMAALRLRDGDRITILNGKGAMLLCRVHAHGREIRAVNVERAEVRQQPDPLVLIMGAIDSRERQEFAVEKAVELGATHIVIASMTHSPRLRSTVDRLMAKAQAAMVQSGRVWLPQVSSAAHLDAALAMVPMHALIVGDANGHSPVSSAVSGPVAIIVGPEGGLSPQERDQLVHHGCTSWRIGNARLRAETAAVALLATVASFR
jgi:16S rRNA (uracil1498-N3)-methyltransferase